MTDAEQFTSKNKQIIYTETFIKFYKMKNHRQVHKIHKMIDFEKMHALIAKNRDNFGVY